MVHFLNLTRVSWKRGLLDLNKSLKSNRMLPISSFIMSMKRKRITMDLKSPIEEAFFARLEHKEWPSLMRLILRDAIRTGRAHELKHGNCFHFDETPLAHEGEPFSDDGRIGEAGNPSAFGPANMASSGNMETDLLQTLPDQLQPASQAKQAAIPDRADSKISPSGAAVVPRAHLGSAIPPSAMSPAEAMELMNQNIEEVRGANAEPIRAQTADRLATSKTPVTQGEAAAAALRAQHGLSSGDSGTPQVTTSNAPGSQGPVAPARSSNAVSPEVALARRATAAPNSPAQAPSASILKGFFGEPGRDRPT